MTSKDAFKARVAKTSTRRPAVAAVTSEPATPTRPTPRTKPVRLSVDTPVQSYRFLTEWAAQVSIELGVPRVAHSEIVRALIRELSQDVELQARIRAAITDVTK